MNDDELRDHLRTAVEPVLSTRPSLAHLRAVRRRRTRAVRVASGGLALVVLAGAGVGIAATTHASGGTTRVVPAVSPSTTSAPVVPASPDVTVGCATGAVTLQVGQTLTISGCAAQAEYAVTDTGVLVRSAADTGALLPSASTSSVAADAHFLASAVGTSAIALSRRPVCSGTCPQLVEAVGRITVTVVPAQATAGAVSVPCGGQTTVVVGTSFVVGGCTDLQSATTSAAVLTPSTSGAFRATAVGSASIRIIEGACSDQQVTCIAVARSATLVVNVVARTDVIATCDSGSTVRMTVGETVTFVGCQQASGPGWALGELGQVSDQPAGVLVPGVDAVTFRAAVVGTAAISLVSCSDGKSCPLGFVQVHVSAATPLPAYDPSDPASWKVSVTGFGPYAIGMTPAEIRAITPGAAERSGGADPARCEYVSVPGLPHVQLLVLDGTFAVTDVEGGSTGSVSGIRVGMTEAALRAVLGPNAQSAPSTVSTDTVYTLTTSQGKASADVRDGRILSFQEGRVADVEDGCA